MPHLIHCVRYRALQALTVRNPQSSAFTCTPNLSSSKEAFSKINGILRKVEARSRMVLIEAMGRWQVARRDHAPKREKILQPLRIPAAGSTVVILAVGE